MRVRVSLRRRKVELFRVCVLVDREHHLNERLLDVRELREEPVLRRAAAHEHVEFGRLADRAVRLRLDGPANAGGYRYDFPERVLRQFAGHSAREGYADGSIVSGGEAGSIHGVGKALQDAPSCNGWMFWHLEHEGHARPIDALRQLYLLAIED